MRIEILKDLGPKYINVLQDILAYEDNKGHLNYHSKSSDNGIAWRPEDLDINLTQSTLKYLLKKGIIVRIKSGVYHINPAIKDKLRSELRYYGEIEKNVNVEKALSYAIHNNSDARAILELLKFQRKWNSMYDDVGWKLSRAREIAINSGSDMSLITRLRDSGMIYQMGENEFSFLDFDDRLLDPYMEVVFSTQDAAWEYLNVVVPMRNKFTEFVNNISQEELEDLKEQIKDVTDVINYSKHVVGPLYMDVLLPIIQQYSMVDLPIVSTNGRKITQSGFSLAYFGEPGTGKTFATDDFIRGNSRLGIPPHGIVGRTRYAEGMTPKKLIAILEAYQNYPVDWIIPEFNDFFRYKGMVEKLKLVMEQREVSDETKREIIKPYKVTSFFIVNYNTKFSNGKWNTTINDPNFNAIEDRMICKVFINEDIREREIYDNMVRRVEGTIDWYLSEPLRKHLTYTYHLLKNKSYKIIMNTNDFIDFGNKIRDFRKKAGVNISNRIILKGVQIAGSASLIKGIFDENKEIYVGETELSLAFEFVREEIETRAMKY